MPLRLSNTLGQSEVESLTNARLVTFLEWQPLHMVAPTQGFPVITNEFNNVLQVLQWGLVPSWAKDVKLSAKMYRTKYENLIEKSSLKAIYDYRRCVVPVTSCVVKTEQNNMHELAAPKGNVFLLAGLWAIWGESLYSFSVITYQNSIENEVTHLPFILSTEDCKEWLSKNNISLSFLTNRIPTKNGL